MDTENVFVLLNVFFENLPKFERANQDDSSYQVLNYHSYKIHSKQDFQTSEPS